MPALPSAAEMVELTVSLKAVVVVVVVSDFSKIPLMMQKKKAQA